MPVGSSDHVQPFNARSSHHKYRMLCHTQVLAVFSLAILARPSSSLCHCLCSVCKVCMPELTLVFESSIPLKDVY